MVVNSTGRMKFYGFLFLYLFVGISFNSNSQKTNLDSVKHLLKIAGQDTNRVNLLNILSWELKDSKTSEALIYAKKAVALASKLHFKTGHVRALGNVGIAYYYQGNYANSLRNYIAAAKLLEGTVYKKKQGAIYNNIALIYLEMVNYKDAEIYFNKSMAIDIELGDNKGLGDSYNNLGVIYKEQKLYQKALDYFNQSLLYRKKANDLDGMPSTLTNLGVINTVLKNYTISEEQLNEALKLYKSNQDDLGVALAMIDLGDLYAERKINVTAIDYYKQSLEIALKEDIKAYISYCYKSLAGCYSQINGFQQAYYYHVKYMSVKDTIYNSDNASAIAEIQTKYETEKKEKDLIRSKAEADKQSAIKNFFMISFVLMGVLSFFIFRGYSGKKKANKIISLQKDIVDEKNREIMDSIIYAKRIQESLLPGERFIDRTLKRLKAKMPE